MEIGASIRSNSSASALMSGGFSEVTAVALDPKTGIYKKARADYVSDKGKILVDLKSSRDASPRGFERACGEYNYHRQAAWYIDTFAEATGTAPELFLFVVYETEAPYACGFYYATAEMIAQGRLEGSSLYSAYASCRAYDSWPGYSDEILPINLPKWKRPKPDTSEMETF